MNDTEITLPPLPGGPGRVLRWLAAPGDPLAAGAPLLIVLSDRAEVAIPAPQAGVLEAQLAPAGGEVAAGGAVGRLQRSEVRSQKPSALSPQPAAPSPQPPARSPQPAAPSRRLGPISPVARQIAAALGIDVAGVAGSGPGGRVRKADVLARAAAGRAGPTTLAGAGRGLALGAAAGSDATSESHPLESPPPSPTPHPPSPTLHPPSPTPHPLSPIPYPPSPIPTEPIITAMIEADAGAALAVCAAQGPAFRRLGLELSLTAYIAWATAALLPAHPALQAAWSAAGLVLRRRTHLAVAEGGAGALRWALIPDAGDLTLRGVARAIGRGPARELRGATFSVVGPAGAQIRRSAVPPLPDTAAALSVGAPRLAPVAAAGAIMIRPLIDLTISYDARALDHRQAMAFLLALRRRIAHTKAEL